MRVTGRWTVTVLLIVACGTAGGCVLAAAGAAAGTGVAYANANAEAVVEAPPERVVEVAQAVFREMQIEPKGEPEYDRQDQEWQIKGSTPASGPAKVTIRQLAPGVSKVWTRVGRFGDKEMSITLMQRIRARL